jgi:thiosulfate/3-mercaptopyruvate sulfurtransferase
MKDEIAVSAEQLYELIQAGDCTVVDCRFDLSNPDRGRAQWLAGHIPGAFYAHLDEDLAAPIEAHSGRHPLPLTTEFAQYLASIAWSDGKLLVAYDDGSNAISSRLWWLMRYFGQPAALLDGGLAAWKEAGLPLEAGEAGVESTPVEHLVVDARMIVSADVIFDSLDSPEMVVLDARAQERFSGEVENLDSKAGHIPGALNRPFGDNLDDEGRFLDPEILKAQFVVALGGIATGSVVHSCGSGITACHNLFAMELAGLGTTRLYPGSWSEWIRDPARPLETGKGS